MSWAAAAAAAHADHMGRNRGREVPVRPNACVHIGVYGAGPRLVMGSTRAWCRTSMRGRRLSQRQLRKDGLPTSKYKWREVGARGIKAEGEPVQPEGHRDLIEMVQGGGCRVGLG